MCYRPLAFTCLDCQNALLTRAEIIFEVEDPPGTGFTAYALGLSIFTETGTVEELREMVHDAVRCHFNPESAPRLMRLHLVKDEVIPACGSPAYNPKH